MNIIQPFHADCCVLTPAISALSHGQDAEYIFNDYAFTNAKWFHMLSCGPSKNTCLMMSLINIYISNSTRDFKMMFQNFPKGLEHEPWCQI